VFFTLFKHGLGRSFAIAPLGRARRKKADAALRLVIIQQILKSSVSPGKLTTKDMIVRPADFFRQALQHPTRLVSASSPSAHRSEACWNVDVEIGGAAPISADRLDRR